jgi:hypothetical protein
VSRGARGVLAVAAAAMVLTSSAAGAPGPRPGAVAPNASARVARALAERYAPLLRLHSGEQWGLMRAPEFLAHASLRWRRVVIAREGTVRAARLGARCARAHGGCYHHAGLRASDLSRPGSADAPGFVLDLDDAFYAGSRGSVPLYDDVRVTRRGVAITYWAFYGYDRPPLDLGPSTPPERVEEFSTQLAHEGDWERVVVLLSPSLAPRGVRYHQHNGSHFVPWAEVPRVGGAGGRHPVVYVARGTHASYSAPGETRLGLAPQACLVDERDAGGRAVESWRPGGLLPVRTRAWYGFGGAWGRSGSIAATTGPLGPSSYKR